MENVLASRHFADGITTVELLHTYHTVQHLKVIHASLVARHRYQLFVFPYPSEGSLSLHYSKPTVAHLVLLLWPIIDWSFFFALPSPHILHWNCARSAFLAVDSYHANDEASAGQREGSKYHICHESIIVFRIVHWRTFLQLKVKWVIKRFIHVAWENFDLMRSYYQKILLHPDAIRSWIVIIIKLFPGPQHLISHGVYSTFSVYF